MSTPQLSDDRILDLKDEYVGDPSDKYPLTQGDWINFARATEQAATAAQAEALAAAQADAASALGLLSKVRFALGDNGTRMQDELIEWCTGLVEDADRYRHLRIHSYVEVACSSLRTSAWNPADLDAAIDAARATLTPTAPGAQEQA